jgi:CheY-like chemotaxis protein
VKPSHLPDVPRDESRPTVVVADDHPAMLEAVSGLLADDFRVVAAVTDGRQAVEAVSRLQPDAVVLDITMPELDGFRTARVLKKNGSGARVVFLTLHDGEEFVHTAFRSGGRGYVLKSRMEADLPSALRHTLASRTFVPSLTALSTITGDAGGHAIHFRGDHGGSYLDEVARFLYGAISRGDMAAVVGTAATRADIAKRLDVRGCDVDEATAQGRYAAFDAADAVSQVMHNGRLDRNKVEEIVNVLEQSRLAFAQGQPGRLVIFGEMNVLILAEGNWEAAIHLEQTWNEVTRTLPFLTVCSYPVQSLTPQQHPKVWATVCAEHSAVCHAHDLH